MAAGRRDKYLYKYQTPAINRQFNFTAKLKIKF